MRGYVETVLEENVFERVYGVDTRILEDESSGLEAIEGEAVEEGLSREVKANVYGRLNEGLVRGCREIYREGVENVLLAAQDVTRAACLLAEGLATNESMNIAILRNI